LLLRRLSDGDALGRVKIATGGATPPAQSRRAIDYFSDLANFSTGHRQATGRVARLLRELAKIQVDAIRKFGGRLDKLVGDGAMAYWIIDTPDRDRIEPMSVMKCAVQIARESNG
jgi:class 3 adenylate cyclase